MRKNDLFSDNLRLALLALIPLAIAELRRTTFAERRVLAEQAARTVAEKADQMMFAAGKQSGVLGPLAQGMAALAYQPGGVTALGVHACAHPHPGCPTRTVRPPCCTCGGDGNSDDQACAWCSKGCPAAESGTQCCAVASPFGRVVGVDR